MNTDYGLLPSGEPPRHRHPGRRTAGADASGQRVAVIIYKTSLLGTRRACLLPTAAGMSPADPLAASAA